MARDPSSILLTDRVVPVTEVGQGIGRATALLLARFGATVAMCDKDREALDRTLALELAPRHLRVNAIAPDAIPAGGDPTVRSEMLGGGAGYDPAVVPPLGTLGDPDDAAAVVVFLVSALARFVTGTTIHVDGGSWAAGGWRRVTDAGYPGEAPPG